MVGIVILNYQTWNLSLRCMASVHKTCVEYPFRIYLVDNASTEPMPKQVAEYMDRHRKEISFMQAPENKGYSAGNNMGIMKALEDGCDPVIIANNDIVFQRHAIKNLVDSIKMHPDVGIVGPKVVNVRGEIQPSRCSMKTGMLEIFQLYTMAKKLFRKKWNRYYCIEQDSEAASYVYHVSGCCFAISRECAIRVMPFDEGTVLYYEELILGIRMEQAGYRTMYEPSSMIVHLHGGTARKVVPFMYQCISQSELYYCSRYLRAKRWQLWMLYTYRKLLYLIRSIGNKGMREYWKKFNVETAKTYRDVKER